MRCIYCGIAEQTNDHSCIKCGAPKAESPEGLIWPNRLPRDEAEKAQLEAEKLRNEVRLQFTRSREAEAAAEESSTRAFGYFFLVLLIAVPFFLSMIQAALFRPPF